LGDDPPDAPEYLDEDHGDGFTVGLPSGTMTERMTTEWYLAGGTNAGFGNPMNGSRAFHEDANRMYKFLQELEQRARAGEQGAAEYLAYLRNELATGQYVPGQSGNPATSRNAETEGTDGFWDVDLTGFNEGNSGKYRSEAESAQEGLAAVALTMVAVPEGVSTVAGGIILGGLAVAGYLAFEDISNPFGNHEDWTYTIPDPTIPQLRTYEKPDVGNRFPNHNGKVPWWVKAVIYTSGAINGVSELNRTGTFDGLNNDIRSKMNKAEREFNDFYDQIIREYQNFEYQLKSGWRPR
jgi:hypothetical protein